MGVKLSLFLALMLLLPQFHCVNWQASGSMSTNMMTAIWTVIGTFDKTQTGMALTNDSPANTYLKDFAVGFSAQLNRAFHQAWNVVISFNPSDNSDTVVYGYAFRGHWFWFNGFQTNDGGFVGFVIWKDYNCQTYIAYNYNEIHSSIGSFDNAGLISLISFTNTNQGSWRYDDVWGTAFNYVDSLQTSGSFGGSAFSIVVSQSASNYLYANVCAVNYFSKFAVASNGRATGGFEDTWGNMLLFQITADLP